jgi:oligoribonuclease
MSMRVFRPDDILAPVSKEEKPLPKMFWVDMEMTGLDERSCVILEVAAVITDWELKGVDEYHAVVHQPESVLASMDEWCVKTHGASGLTKEVASGKPLQEVEAALIALAKKHFGALKIVLAGNSIGQDRKFIDAYMPAFASTLHYRLIDVSSFKEVFRSKYNVTYKKKEAHRARDDIYESIAELKEYLKYVTT